MRPIPPPRGLVFPNCEKAGETMIYCPLCGAANEPDAPFCYECGAELPRMGPRPEDDATLNPFSGAAPARAPAPAEEEEADATLPVPAAPRRRAEGSASPSVPGAELGEPVGMPAPRPPRKPRRVRRIALAALALALAAAALLLLPRVLSRPKDPTQAALDQILAAAAPYEDSKGCVSPENRQAAIDAVYASARSSALVSSCYADPYGVYIEIPNSPPVIYCPQPEPLIFDPVRHDTEDPARRTGQDPADPQSGESGPADPIPGDGGGEDAAQPAILRQEGRGTLQILTVQPFDAQFREIDRAHGFGQDLDAPDLVAWETVNRDPQLWHFGENANLNDGAVTLEQLLHLDQYQVILWHGLGAYTSYTGYYLCTDIPWSEELAERYGLDAHNCCRMLDGTIGLGPAFFAENYPDGAFDNAFLYLATSYSGMDEQMARVFLDKGAAVVFVTSENISRSYDLEMLHLTAESFLAGPEGCKTGPALEKRLRDYGVPAAEPWTIRDSLQLAQDSYGAQDPYLEAGARVYYLCRPGMEDLSYADWLALFRSPGSAAQRPAADQRLEINRAATRFWAVWYKDDYDCQAINGLDLLEYGFSMAARERFTVAGSRFLVPLEQLNRHIQRAFNTAVSLEEGQTYCPDPNNANWYYLLKGGQVSRPGSDGELDTTFHRLQSSSALSDGSIQLVFTRYRMEAPAVQALLAAEGPTAEEYAVLSDAELEGYGSRGWVSPVGTATMIVLARTENPASLEDYYILRCWFSPDEQPAPAAPAGERSDLDGEYTVRVKEVLDGGAALRVSIMEPVIWDRDYVMSLRVGDPVTVLGQTYYVRETPPAGQLGYYFLENGPYLSLTAEGDCLLCWSGEEAVMEPVEELILPVSPDFSVEIFRYGEMGSESLSLQRLEERYGPDLLSYDIRLTVVNGIAIAGSILLFY